MFALSELRDLDIVLFTVGGAAFTISSIAKLIVLVGLLLFCAGRVGALTERIILRRAPLDLGTRRAFGTIVRYAVLLVGTLIIVQTAGIDLTTFNVLAGAIGVGVGFGLQNIVSNFISGLIIMFERPIKVGDRIELAGTEGTIAAIGARRTTVVTRDNIAIIVPNQRFILENVVNLLYVNSQIRVHVPLSVAPGTDERTVETVMLNVARAHPHVLSNPAPTVQLLSLGGAAMQFELLVWSDLIQDSRRDLASALNFAISAQLRSHSIRTA